MTVLTDKEINALSWGEINSQLSEDMIPFARLVEAAVIKRLAAGVSVEPVGSVIEHVGVTDGVVEFTTPTCGPLPIGTNLVTLDQLTAAIAAARVRENERIADWYYNNKHRLSVFEVPDAIRALLGKEAQP